MCVANEHPPEARILAAEAQVQLRRQQLRLAVKVHLQHSSGGRTLGLSRAGGAPRMQEAAHAQQRAAANIRACNRKVHAQRCLPGGRGTAHGRQRRGTCLQAPPLALLLRAARLLLPGHPGWPE